jgi:hypothetical protein
MRASKAIPLPEQQVLHIPQRPRTYITSHQSDHFRRWLEIAKRVVSLAHPSGLTAPRPLHLLSPSAAHASMQCVARL